MIPEKKGRFISKRTFIIRTHQYYQFLKRVLIIWLFLTACFVPALVLCQGQHKDGKYYAKAKEAYWSKELKKAAQWASKAIKKNPSFIKAYLLLGEIAEDQRDTARAIAVYEKILTIDTAAYPLVYYFLGELYYKNGDYQKAQNALHTYLAHRKHIPNAMQVQADYERARFAAAARGKPWKITVFNTSDRINSAYDEYINFVNEDKTALYFTRKVPLVQENEEALWRRFEEKIYVSHKDSNQWLDPSLLDFPWKNNQNMGAVSFSTDSRTLFFTGCYLPEGMGSCDLYFSRKKGKKWLIPVNAGSNLNSSQWDSQAILSSDGRTLFFSSKRTGGKGGSDIWFSTRKNDGTWGSPKNAGDSINTPKDEMSPFLFADNNTLYFSSKGHPGFGGFDLFVARKDSLNNWTHVCNLGYPVNSRYNEINIFISLDAKHAWISSDREGTKGGFDVFDFQLPHPIAPKAVYYLKGVTLSAKDKKPLSADVILTNLKNGRQLDSTRSDGVNGSFLAVLQQDVDYAVNISKSGYIFLSKHIDTYPYDKFNSIRDTFLLPPIDTGSVTKLYNINFDFDKAILKPSAFPELNRLLRFLKANATIRIEISGHTDQKGGAEYNQILSEKRAFSVYHYLINKGIRSDRMQTKGYGFSQPLCTEKTELCAAKNRRTEIKITDLHLGSQ